MNKRKNLWIFFVVTASFACDISAACHCVTYVVQSSMMLSHGHLPLQCPTLWALFLCLTIVSHSGISFDSNCSYNWLWLQFIIHFANMDNFSHFHSMPWKPKGQYKPIWTVRFGSNDGPWMLKALSLSAVFSSRVFMQLSLWTQSYLICNQLW